MDNAIEIYCSQDGSIQLNVKLENDTVWLTQSQMAELFGRDRTVIGRHINNCYKEGELDRSITCAKFAHMGADQDQVYEMAMYNLDVIISVGYRVKSLQGTRFRQWANSVLKQYLIKGYAINQQIRLDRYNELKDVVRLMSRAVSLQEKVTSEEYGGLFNVISDGNKRIAAMLFLWFLNNNHVLYAEDGHKRIADNTLVALTLMIAESRTEEKDVMVKVVVNLINKANQ